MHAKCFYCLSFFIAILGLFIATDGLQAHKPVTSKFTYYKHVQPLFRFYCGGCHASNKIAPMSLLTYKEAYPWAESIKEQLLADSMHPWHDEESFGIFTHGQRMTPRQMDMIIDWTNGGTPEGTPPLISSPPMQEVGWALGMPDLILPMPTPALIDADQVEKTVEFILPTGLGEDRWLTAIDLKPGYPGMVHNAIVYLTNGSSNLWSESNADILADQILGTWIPGRIGEMAEEGAYHIPADAQLTLRIHYRKTWRDEGIERSDQSTLGLYFTQQPPQQIIRTLVLQASQENHAQRDTIRMEQTFARDIFLNGIMPGMSRAGQAVQIKIKMPDNENIDLLRITQIDQGWPIRYDFKQSIYIPRGSRIIITGTFGENQQTTINSGTAPHRMKVWVDYTL